MGYLCVHTGLNKGENRHKYSVLYGVSEMSSQSPTDAMNYDNPEVTKARINVARSPFLRKEITLQAGGEGRGYIEILMLYG